MTITTSWRNGEMVAVDTQGGQRRFTMSQREYELARPHLTKLGFEGFPEWKQFEHNLSMAPTAQHTHVFLGAPYEARRQDPSKAAEGKLCEIMIPLSLRSQSIVILLDHESLKTTSDFADALDTILPCPKHDRHYGSPWSTLDGVGESYLSLMYDVPNAIVVSAILKILEQDPALKPTLQGRIFGRDETQEYTHEELFGGPKTEQCLLTLRHFTVQSNCERPYMGWRS